MNTEYSLILYGSSIKACRSHMPVTHQRFQPAYYVRSVLVPGSCERAFERANPKPGEIVLNTVPVENEIPFNPLRKEDA